MAVKLKLLVNKETKKVVFAEAGKEFVDFLMGLMEIPLGSILRALKKASADGNPNLSLEKLYQSIQLLEDSFLQKSDLKNSLLEPKSSTTANVKQAPVLNQMIQRSSSSSSYYGSSQRDEIDGYVKGAATYMVMDDLTVTPSSAISSINLFNIHGVRDIGCLQEMIVEVDGKKAVELVRAAFQSSTVLTDVFIGTAPKNESVARQDNASKKRARR